jgi:hypothetical protein
VLLVHQEHASQTDTERRQTERLGGRLLDGEELPHFRLTLEHLHLNARDALGHHHTGQLGRVLKRRSGRQADLLGVQIVDFSAEYHCSEVGGDG